MPQFFNGNSEFLKPLGILNHHLGFFYLVLFFAANFRAVSELAGTFGMEFCIINGNTKLAGLTFFISLSIIKS